MAALKLYLMGHFHLTIDEQMVDGFRSERARALLAYLVVENIRPVQRSYLARLLWDGYDPDAARLNLRVTLSNLRQLLLPFQPIRATYHTVQFDVTTVGFWCDVLALEAVVGVSHLHSQSALTAEARALYNREFLEGLDTLDSRQYQEWLNRQRQRYRQLLERLGQNSNQIQLPGQLKAAQPASAGLPDQSDKPRPAQSGERRKQKREATAVSRVGMGVADRSAPLNQAPQVAFFHGRQRELKLLGEWVSNASCRLVIVLGMGGQGKTLLAAHCANLLATQQQERIEEGGQPFFYILWRSLVNAPPLAEVLHGWLEVLSGQAERQAEGGLDRQLDRLFTLLQRKRCLLVLDNLEGLLAAGERAGYFRVGYEEYGYFLEQFALYPHRSCLLVTSREEPQRLRLLMLGGQTVQSLRLAGLSLDAGCALLDELGLYGELALRRRLVERYSGNPLALKLVAATISDLFGGEIKQFLADDNLVFDDIRDILDQQFARLSTLEQTALKWLAVEREPILFDAVCADLVQPAARRLVLEAMRSLQRRMLLEQDDNRYGLQNVILEYITDRLVQQTCQTIEQSTTSSIELLLQSVLNGYSLVKAQAKEYVRQIQERLLLHPVAEWFTGRWGKARFADHVQRMIQRLQQEAPLSPGYIGANLLHLLLYLRLDLRGYDFSRLALWQADLRKATLPAFNLAHADLTGSVFVEPLATVRTLCFSLDGQIVFMGQANGDICAWRLADFRLQARFRGHQNVVDYSACSPDGKLLASGSQDGTVRIWDLDTGACRAVLPDHADSVILVHFCADGQELITLDSVGVLRVWVLADAGARIYPRARFSDGSPAFEAAATTNGIVLLTGGVDPVLRWWDVTAGRLRLLPTVHTNVVFHLTLDAHGQRLATTGVADQSVCIWQLDQAGEEWRLCHQLPVAALHLALSPDGTRLAGAYYDYILLWDVESGQLLHQFNGHTGRVMRLAFSPDGSTLASASLDQTVRFWNVQSGRLNHVLWSYTAWVDNICYSPDGSILASSHFDNTVHLWGPAGEHRHTLRGHQAVIRAMAFSPDGALLATASDDKTVRLWHVQRGEHLDTLRGHTNMVRDLAFHPTGSILATAGADHMLVLWDVQTRTQRQILTGHTHWVVRVAFSADGSVLASIGEHTACLWETASGRLLHTLDAHADLVLSIAFSPDDQFVFTASSDKILRRWRVADGQLCQAVETQAHHIVYLAFDVTGTTLVTASENQLIEVWDVEPATGSLAHRYTVPDQIYTYTAVAISPDGALVVSGGLNGILHIRDLASGQLRQALAGHAGLITAVRFAATGQVVSSSGDGAIRIWDPQTGHCLHVLQPDGPYAGMNITGVTGISDAQKTALKALGAVEDALA